MILFDTETTELMKPDVADPATQPHMIEIAMLVLDDNYKEEHRFTTLLKPGVPLNEEEHKAITKITNADLEDQPTFLEVYADICTFFLGESTIIAHNLQFDLMVLVTELRRIGKEYAFPYPSMQICTVDRTKHLLGRRLKLTELYERTLKKKLAQTHRAMDDVEALAEIVRKLKVK